MVATRLLTLPASRAHALCFFVRGVIGALCIFLIESLSVVLCLKLEQPKPSITCKSKFSEFRGHEGVPSKS